MREFTRAITLILILVSLVLMFGCQDNSETGIEEQPPIKIEQQADTNNRERAPEKTYTFAALEGSVIIKTEGRKVVYRKKCNCGYVLPGTVTTYLSPGATYRSSFRCPKCKQRTNVAIQCSR